MANLIMNFQNRLTLQDNDFISYVESDIRSFLENLSEKRSTVAISSKVYLPSNETKIVSNQFAVESCCESVQENRKKVKLPRTMPSISIYRPPAARKLERNSNLSNIQPREMMGTSSPVKNKLKATEDSKEICPAGRRNENDGISVFRNAITSIRTQNKVPKCKNVDSANKKRETEPKVKLEQVVKIANQSKQRRPDIKVYVPKGRRSVGLVNETKKFCPPFYEEKLCRNSEPEVAVVEEGVGVDSLQQKKPTMDTQVKQQLPNAFEARSISKTSENTENISSPPTDFNETSCSTSNVKSNLSAEKNSHSNSENISVDKSSQKVQMGHLNPEEYDWETMYDDTGECLDPSLLAQLTSEVGEVTLEKPKSSYSGYKTKPLDTFADEFPHVIEIYNFPPEFQLQDLMMVFSQFKNSGFEIKWVDDTHALGIFSSSAIVSEVLDFYHPFVKTRSLKEGTLLSKIKARRSAEFLLPYKPRPETCSALARRLVTGALGVRLPTSRQEREAEKQILTKARERKRLEAKQKEDAWEGTFG